MSIEDNIQEIQKRIARAAERAGRSPGDITLVAASKTVAPSGIRAAAEAGLRHFGENRVQEATGKMDDLADLRPDLIWHMVGHLQTNKAGAALSLFDIIESVDSLRLARALSARAEKPLPILLEVNVAAEASKTGFSPGELTSAVTEISRLPHLRVLGLMTIAPPAPDPEGVRPVFRALRELAGGLGLAQLSMGMSDDFEVAVGEGATIVRVGRAIFGERMG
ncbi:MAG: YggS family pyridoxal phosphate-dependent enzyme [Dehalococcoidia bacterium]